MKKALFLFLWWPFAQAIAQPQTLDLETAWHILLQQNLTLQQYERAIAQSKLETDVQKTNFFPTLAVVGSYRHLSQAPHIDLQFQLPGGQQPSFQAGLQNQYDFAAVVQQPIFTGLRTRNLVKSARSQNSALQVQMQVLQNQLLLQTGQLYYQIQLNRLQQGVLENSIRRAGVQLEKVRNFFLAGQATDFDTLEVFNRRLQIHNQLQNLKSVQRVLLSKFRYLLNQNEPLQIAPLAIDSLNMALETLESYQEQARASRPELRQLGFLEQAQTHRAKALQSVHYPQIFANVAYHYSNPGLNYVREEWMDYYTIGVDLQWQIWTWRRDSKKISQATLEVERLRLQQQDVLQKIRQEVEDAYEQLQSAQEQIVLQRNLVAQERERYRITNNRYSAGQATSLDLSTAESALTAAELQLQADTIKWYQSHLQLDFATGQLRIEN